VAHFQHARYVGMVLVTAGMGGTGETEAGMAEVGILYLIIGIVAIAFIAWSSYAEAQKRQLEAKDREHKIMTILEEIKQSIIRKNEH
jgi:hypothetical protein